MKRISFILIICFVFVISTYAQTENTLKKGMLNTVTLSTGEVVYNLKGEWNAIYDIDVVGTIKDIIKITQDGNKFVGIKLIGNEFMPKGREAIKGELGKNGFKSLYGNTSTDGWLPATGEIGDKCNKIIITIPNKRLGITIVITLTRK